MYHYFSKKIDEEIVSPCFKFLEDYTARSKGSAYEEETFFQEVFPHVICPNSSFLSVIKEKFQEHSVKSPYQPFEFSTLLRAKNKLEFSIIGSIKNFLNLNLESYLSHKATFMKKPTFLAEIRNFD